MLPSALWRLAQLESLNLSNCGLESVPPAEIGGLAAGMRPSLISLAAPLSSRAPWRGFVQVRLPEIMTTIRCRPGTWAWRPPALDRPALVV